MAGEIIRDSTVGILKCGCWPVAALTVFFFKKMRGRFAGPKKKVAVK